MPADLDTDADDQDMAEIYDEENITEDGREIAHLDMMRDVFDVTSADGDADDEDAEDDDDFDPDEADDDELDKMLENDDGIDGEMEHARDEGDLVMSEDETPAAYEGDDGGIEDDDDRADTHADSPPSPKQERELDHGLDETFPASDPVSISPGAD